jgi:hypothetical protein
LNWGIHVEAESKSLPKKSVCHVVDEIKVTGNVEESIEDPIREIVEESIGIK